MRKTSIFITFIFYAQFLLGQQRDLIIIKIDSIVKIIDSTCISAGILDFNLHKKGTKKTIGGGADWFYTDSSGNKLVKVVREISAYSDQLDSYYFRDDSLIYLHSKISKPNGELRKTSSIGKYYFQHNKLIYKIDNLRSPLNTVYHLENSKYYLSKSKLWGK